MKRFLILCTLAVLLLLPVTVADEDKEAFTQETFLHQDPDPAEPGEYVELRWKVSKHGDGVVENLSFRLRPQYPFTLDPQTSARRHIGRWRGISDTEEGYYTLYYKLRVAQDTLNEQYPLVLEKSYDGEEWMSKEYDIRVEEPKKPEMLTGIVKTSPQELRADMDEIKMHIELHNVGEEKAENVQARLKLPEGFSPAYSYSTQTYLGALNEGGMAPLSFYLDTDEGLSAGVHEAFLDLTYKEADEDQGPARSVRIPLNLTIHATPQFRVEGTGEHEFTTGQSGYIRVNVTNYGDATADTVSVHALKDASQPFEMDEKSDYVGTLESSQSGEALIPLSVDSDAGAKEYIMDLEVRGIHEDEVVTEEHQVRLTVEEAEQRPARTTGIIIAAGIVILGLVAYIIGRQVKS